MDKRDFYDLLIFQEVSEAGSFTRAAARMGRAQSGISQSIAALEARLGVPLLARSTRSVQLTKAGRSLLEQVSPALQQIAASLEATREGGKNIRGVLRLTSMEYPARKILIPLLSGFLKRYPHVKVDIDVNNQFVDIIKGGFDAGIRFGPHIEKDMVAVPLSSSLRVVIVGSPSYFSQYGCPKKPEDLAEYNCVNIRMATNSNNFRWLFQKNLKTVELPVEGRMLVNDTSVLIQSALAGLGLIYTFEQHVTEHLASGALKRCLDDYCPEWMGYYIYYPGRNQKSSALSVLIEELQNRRYAE